MRNRPVLAALTALTVVTSLLAPTAAAAADCTWRLSPLPVRDGMDWSNLRITSVDAQGNVSGFHTTKGENDHALTRWTATGVEVVPRPEGATAFVTIAGNASGVVIGRVDRPGGGALMTHTPGVGYRDLPLPAGYDVSMVSLTDINDRGDVLAKWWGTSTLPQAALLWRADGSAPVVINPPEVPRPNPVAIRNDGTVLLGGTWDPVWLWRDGALTSLGDWGSSVRPRDLTRDGLIATRDYDRPRTSWKWHESTGQMERVDVDGVIEEVNEDGLAIGYLDDGRYTYAVWQGTRFVATLPMAAGASEATASAVGANGVIAGYSGTKPVVWTCG
ncbi:hypothetical protein [Lentzea sp. HUAS12]|uniref:hypothetical protein n=1 Tax=Lentzea sp. HUAS12 TaxID=2951806 RepID=UPI00209F35C7|nr:hypothetical protein [Lentzea sp. HUAS12]USX53659.1 hypothetical protein ND450_06035 [Lentzea sp. HUAS12]